MARACCVPIFTILIKDLSRISESDSRSRSPTETFERTGEREWGGCVASGGCRQPVSHALTLRACCVPLFTFLRETISSDQAGVGRDLQGEAFFFQLKNNVGGSRRGVLAGDGESSGLTLVRRLAGSFPTEPGAAPRGLARTRRHQTRALRCHGGEAACLQRPGPAVYPCWHSPSSPPS